MWSANKLTADAASKLQVGAGILVKDFNVSTPTEPADESILFETTGDYHVVCRPIWQDLFEGVNNAAPNTKEGKRIKGWEASLTITAISFTEETIKMGLAAAEGTATTGIKGRQIKVSDFTKITYLAEMQDENSLLAIVMDDAINTSGIDLTATDDGKGGMSLNIVPHTSLKNPEVPPMAFYLLTKQGAAV